MKKIGFVLLVVGVIIAAFATWWFIESVFYGGVSKMSADYDEAKMFMSGIPFSRVASIFTFLLGLAAVIIGMKFGGIIFFSKTATVEHQVDTWLDEMEYWFDGMSKSVEECLLKPRRFLRK